MTLNTKATTHKTMANKQKGLTPMMQQFFSFKEKYPDALLLFRCGDFYETYCDDAVEASRILGITLTRRNNGASVGDEMAGFPYHALDSYLPKLVRAGKRVAICDQLEDPKLTKKLVKRGVTELVTPGVAMTDGVLQHKENNFLAAVHFGRSASGVAFLDISTGEFLCGQGTYDYVEKLLGSMQPKEVLYQRERRHDFQQYFGTHYCVYEMDEWAFQTEQARQRLCKHFRVKSLKGFGVDHLDEGITAAGATLHYLEMTQHTQLGHITQLRRLEEERYVRLDRFTARSLELIETMQPGGTTLLDVVDRTVSPMGARMMRRWLLFPLKDRKEIEQRLDQVDTFYRDPELRGVVDEQLSLMGDLERLCAKASTGRINPREMVQLRTALHAVASVKEALRHPSPLSPLADTLDNCQQLVERLDRQLRDDAPMLVAKGGVVKTGCNDELDQLRDISHSGKDYLLRLQQQEAEKTGIQSLKVGYNNVFGYYLEVRNTYKSQVPPEWIRKQTLAQAERYITEELKQYEEKILGAEDRIIALETQLFQQMVAETQQYVQNIQRDAHTMARLDCLLSFTKAAEEHRYVRPVVDDTLEIDIRQGRHPVIETQMPVGEKYVPNDVHLDHDHQQIIIITGPNMAGKSALLRQTALIVLLAQVGCYVPAEAARIGLVDKIFTRVGASDNISLGESTFMVEMTEAANILNNATERSLVLFDELGRGTSTYDGISIAWAIVEFLHEQPRAQARTLFATHYHELNDMARLFSRIRNYNVAVKEAEGRVIFLRRLQQGGAEHSFGIHVAEMAGMPRSIVRRANDILHQLEADSAQVTGTQQAKTKPSTAAIGQPTGTQLSFFQLDDPVLSQVRDEILGLDVNNLTPIEALNKLNEIRKIVSGR